MDNCSVYEPGTPIDNAHTFTAKDETFWDNYPSSLNKTIDADTIKSLIGRTLQYGYTGNIDPTLSNSKTSFTISEQRRS